MKKLFISLICILGLACVTSSAQSIKDNSKTKTKYTSIVELLRGIPGVTVKGGGGGTMPDVTVRGIGTNTDATQPLFVVDDVITDNIMYLNPDDVHHVEALKDGTAAIYGVQGANGVIMIFTNTFVENQERAAEQARLAKELAKREKQEAKEAKKSAKKK